MFVNSNNQNQTNMKQIKDYLERDAEMIVGIFLIIALVVCIAWMVYLGPCSIVESLKHLK